MALKLKNTMKSEGLITFDDFSTAMAHIYPKKSLRWMESSYHALVDGIKSEATPLNLSLRGFLPLIYHENSACENFYPKNKNFFVRAIYNTYINYVTLSFHENYEIDVEEASAQGISPLLQKKKLARIETTTSINTKKAYIGLRNNFSNNFADSNAIILLYNFQATSFLEISDCLFVENNSSSNGATIYFENFGYVLQKGTIFQKILQIMDLLFMCSNSKSYSKLEITDCVFNDNNATLSGGAIYMELYGNISIRSKFLHNSVVDGGAALFFFNCQPNSLLEITECDFIENNSTYSGGAFYMEQFKNV